MSLSDEWQEVHLTPDGWVKGSFKVDSGYGKEVRPPENRVLTILIQETIEATEGWFQDMETRIREIWRGSDEKLINELLEKFGPGPDGITA